MPIQNLAIETCVVVWPRVQTNLKLSIGALQIELKWEEKYGNNDSEQHGSVMHQKTSPREERAGEKSTQTLLAGRKSSRCGDRSSVSTPSKNVTVPVVWYDAPCSSETVPVGFT
jgi:hypothetical protein